MITFVNSLTFFQFAVLIVGCIFVCIILLLNKKIKKQRKDIIALWIAIGGGILCIIYKAINTYYTDNILLSKLSGNLLSIFVVIVLVVLAISALVQSKTGNYPPEKKRALFTAGIILLVALAMGVIMFIVFKEP